MDSLYKKGFSFMAPITKHNDTLIPIYNDWQEVAYYQPIEAAVSAWIEAGCPSVLNSRGRSAKPNFFTELLPAFMLYLYTLNQYRNVREYLSTNVQSQQSNAYDWMIANIDHVFKTIPPLVKTQTAYRGLDKSVNLSKEGYILNVSYASFTLDRDVANFFRFGQTGQTEVKAGQKEPGTLLVVQLPPGTPAIPLYYLQDERMNPEEEILLPRTLKVKPRERKGYILYCDVSLAK